MPPVPPSVPGKASNFPQTTLSYHWDQILKNDKPFWTEQLNKAASGNSFVMLCSSVGTSGAVLTHDSLLAAALTLRGTRVEVFLCDAALPACEICTWFSIPTPTFLQDGPQKKRCDTCWPYGISVFEKLGIKIHRFSQYLEPADYEFAKETVQSLADDELANFCLDGATLGEEAYAASLRYFFVGDLRAEPDGIRVLRRYLESAILVKRAVHKLFITQQPDVAVFHHGVYVPQGVIGQVARQTGVRVVNWSVGYRNRTFVYSHEDTYHRTMIDEPIESWRDKPLRPKQEKKLMDYLDSRLRGSEDWSKIHGENYNPQEDFDHIRQSLGLDERPICLLLTNVTWDAQLYYKNVGFPSLLDWVEYTIRSFESRPDLQLVIRIHPSETNRATRQLVMNVMKERLGPNLPKNVFVVKGTSKISTYALGEMADSVIIFGTKTGVEMAARGIPVIVAGEAWVRNKGITRDVSSMTEYQQVLDSLPLLERMSPEQTELAKRYAYHYFFRRMMPFSSYTSRTGKYAKITNASSSKSLWSKIQRKVQKQEALPNLIQVSTPFDLDIERLHQLLPGKDKALDILCEGILQGTPFIYTESQTAERSLAKV